MMLRFIVAMKLRRVKEGMEKIKRKIEKEVFALKYNYRKRKADLCSP